MTLPSLDNWYQGRLSKPRLLILEVRSREAPNCAPIAWVLVEREEIFHRDPHNNILYRASIKLHYTRLLPKHEFYHLGGEGWFAGSYLRDYRGAESVSLTSAIGGSGGVFMDLPGLKGERIGTYLMSEIVQWVKEWPEAIVDPIDLVDGQAEGKNRERRNRLYEQFGITFDYVDGERRTGRSRPMRVAELLSVNVWKQNIKEIGLSEHIAALMYSVSECDQQGDRIKELAKELRFASDHPTRWYVHAMWSQYRRRVTLGILLIVVATMTWLRL